MAIWNLYSNDSCGILLAISLKFLYKCSSHSETKMNFLLSKYKYDFKNTFYKFLKGISQKLLTYNRLNLMSNEKHKDLDEKVIWQAAAVKTKDEEN